MSNRYKRIERQQEVMDKLREASKVEGDPFWASVLFNCSRGRFPKGGFSFYNGILSYGKGSSKREVTLSGSAIEMGDRCLEFFKKFGGIYSPRDRKEMKDDTEEAIIDTSKLDDWGQVRLVSERCVLIERFIEENYEERPRHVKRRMFNLICAAMDMKKISSKDIDYSRGKIRGIERIREESHNVFCVG